MILKTIDPKKYDTKNYNVELYYQGKLVKTLGKEYTMAGMLAEEFLLKNNQTELYEMYNQDGRLVQTIGSTGTEYTVEVMQKGGVVIKNNANNK